MDTNKELPYEIIDVDPVTSEALRKHFPGSPKEFVYLGPKRYLFYKQAKDTLLKLYCMEIRPTDVWIITNFRSGTTLTQELIWQLAHDMNIDEASDAGRIYKKFPFLEFPAFLDPQMLNSLIKAKPQYKDAILSSTESKIDVAANNKSPRFIKSHLALSLQSPNLVDTAKVIYVARDPRDVAVSCYHFYKLLMMFQYAGDFKTFWNIYQRGLVCCMPYFEHVKEAWDLRDHPNMLFMFYEDIVKNTPKAIRRVASFLNKQPTDEQVAQLAEQLNIDNFRKNKAVNYDNFKELGFMISDDNNSFIRKGKVGGWRDYFDDEMTKQADEWIKENLKNTDLRFPED